MLAGYDKEHVRRYIKLFSDSALASLFKGYFACTNELVSNDDEEFPLYIPPNVDPVDTLLVKSILTHQDLSLLIFFQNAYSNLSNTILGNRMVGEVYLGEEDYENAIKASKLGLEALDRLESDSGKVLSR